jgi:CRP-like cAMP-binding protein
MSAVAEMDFKDFAANVGTIMDYAPGDMIFREGDEPNFMYLVLRGSVEIIVRGVVLEKIGPGKALGILSLLDGEIRSASARACEATQLALIDHKKFRYMMEEMPQFCWYVMGELAHRLRATNAAL